MENESIIQSVPGSGSCILSSSQKWAGSGTSTDPYQISTIDDIKALSQYVNTGNSTTNVYFILTNDIDMNGVSDFAPIGGWPADTTKCLNYGFKGKFDGNGKAIKNLSIKYSMDVKGAGVGLFGYVKGDAQNMAEIRNIGIVAASHQGYQFVGALCGQIENTVLDNVYATGHIGATQVSGGIFGIATNCVVTSSYASVDVDGQDFLGGFCGENSNGTSISNCYSLASVTGNNNIGGFCGINGGKITESYAMTYISAQDNVGGFCGKNSDGSIDKCYVGNINIYGHFYVGGFCGENDASRKAATISNSYTMAVIRSNDYTGGFCGKMDHSSSSLKNCYAAGTVLATTVRGKMVGGFCGQKSGGSINNCYRGSFVATLNSYGTAMSEADMKKPAFVSSLNSGQNPPPWLADTAGASALNKGFPVLEFQTPYLDVQTLPATNIGRTTAQLNASCIERLQNIKSKGFLYKRHSDSDWHDIPVSQEQFCLNMNNLTVATAYDNKAYVITQNGDQTQTVYGDITSFSTRPKPVT